MGVYVDASLWPHRRMVMCHMIADTLDELHAMADRIGVARRWFQGNHYDICKSKRTLAIGYGAQEVSAREIVRILKQIRRGGRHEATY